MSLRTSRQAEPSRRFGGQEGKGAAGCIFFLALLAIAITTGIKVLPPYYAYKSLETDIKTEVSRAGAHFHDNESIIKNIVSLGRRNEIPLTRKNVQLNRFAGQVHITVRYSERVDLPFYPYDMDFEIKASSFVGRL